MKRVALALAFVASVAAGCDGNDQETEPALEALIAFARDPSDANWDELPLAASVGLGLGDTVRARRTAVELRRPAAWTLSVDGFRGRAGTASALELIAAEDGPLSTTSGPHPHCASPPVPAPPSLGELRRVAVQPGDADGCLDWWTVDAFVDARGRIVAVTLDLWEP